MTVTEFETKEAKEERLLVEHFNDLAKIRRISYEAHIKAGWEHQDAMWLCYVHEGEE